MNKINLAAELARRGRVRKRNVTALRERLTATRDSGFTLLLAALMGESESGSLAGPPKNEVRKATPTVIRQTPSQASSLPANLRKAKAPANPTDHHRVSSLTVAALPNHPSPGSPMVEPRRSHGGASLRADQALTEHEVDGSALQDYQFIESDGIHAGRVESPSYDDVSVAQGVESTLQTFDEPSAPFERMSGTHELSGQIMTDVQELLRDSEARANEERARRELAVSRARLACYR